MSEYKDFFTEVEKNGQSIILYSVPCDENLHPAETDSVAVLIRDTRLNKTLCVSFKHGDYPIQVDKETFLKNVSILKNRKWVFDKKSFIQKFPLKDLIDVNLYCHIENGNIFEKQQFETAAHKFIYRTKSGNSNLNKAVPILKHKEMFDRMCNDFINSLPLESNLDSGFLKENEVVIETLAELESNGIYVNPECFKQHWDVKISSNNLVRSQYNVYTATGRPSNHFDNINYAALNKETGVRKCFVSRYGKDGKMVLIDYSAFHPRIITYLVNFPLPIDVDIYHYLGQLYFNREDNIDIDLSKQLTFRQLYGGVEEQFESIKYYARLKNFVKTNWANFEKEGYVLTPIFKRKITDKHLNDPNPNKLFNYILQATETEVAIPAVNVVNQYLKNKSTKAILYTYDSILFDFHKNDGGKCLEDVMTIMKMNGRFPIKVYMGDSYATVTQIHP